MDLFTGGSVIMDYFGQKRCFNGFVSYVQTLHKMLIDALVCIIVMFLSAVWTLILMAPIHCRVFISEQTM